MPPEQNPTPEQVTTPPIAANNSGMGSGTEVPVEIRDKWNWGAFGFNWIWGIGNDTWIALLMFVPIANLVMLILLGIKGNEWAWQNKHWESLEQFKRVQHLWAKVWFILLIVTVVFWILIGIFSVTLLGVVLHSRGY